VLITIQEFLYQHGMEILSINLRVSNRGQIEYCTGTFRKVAQHTYTMEVADRNFKLLLARMDYRFLETELEVVDDKFIITSKYRENIEVIP
jgi:hypothetical protein